MADYGPVSGTIFQFAEVRERLRKAQKSAKYCTGLTSDVHLCSPAIGRIWGPNWGPFDSLTSTILLNSKPKAKPYKLADEKGLFLLVQPSGGMLWRMKYRVDGRDEAGNPKRVEKKLALAPEITLKDARARRNEARHLLAQLNNTGAGMPGSPHS